MSRVFKAAGVWALGADEVQWILYRAQTRKTGAFWGPILFVSSTKAILKDRMREAGVEPGSRQKLLEGLPDTFQDWKTSRSASWGD